MVLGVELTLCSSSVLALSGASERFNFSVTTPSFVLELAAVPEAGVPEAPVAREPPENEEGDELIGDALALPDVDAAVADEDRP